LSFPSWTLAEVAEMCGGCLTDLSSADLSFGYEAICTDSRRAKLGDFFVALRGENHDGHGFLRQVAATGAMAALVDHPLDDRSLPQIVVRDSLAGWQSWGAAHRACFPGVKLIGLTGSSGKTSTKDLLTHLLSGVGATWATQGNRNNHIGVPWTLLGLDATDRFAVIEMGMNHPREIAGLAELARPTVALITDIGTAHVGHLGSREAILRAKLEILEGTADSAPIVLPQDSWVLERLPAEVRPRQMVTFGLDAAADWHPAGPVEWSLEGTRFATPLAGPVRLSLLGQGAVLSTLAALAVCQALGEDPRPLIPRLETAPRRTMRMEPRLLGGVQWLLDCYNASPESARLALNFLREIPYRGRRVLVLGELGELGQYSREIHQDLGRRAGAIETVLFVGPEAKTALEAIHRAALPSSTAAWVPGTDEAAEWLRPRLREGDLVLLKGSRRVALERILERLYPAGSAEQAQER
jgi:UDP-N-acetylmuramoyl-tripeptide--D-alanyl-D-alanine ligase